jgi:outer membrane protein
METLRLDARGTYEFVPPPFPESRGGEPLSLDLLVSRALEQRLDLDAVEARVGAAEEDVRAARGGRWPTVFLSAGYGSTYTSAADAGFLDQLDDRRSGSIGLGIVVPLFDRGGTAIASRRAEIALDSARLSLEVRQQDIGLQVRRAWLDFRAALAQLEAAQAQVRAADRALDVAQERYDAGAATLVELTQSRATQVQAASSLVAARYTLVLQRTLLDFYTGELDPDQLTVP